MCPVFRILRYVLYVPIKDCDGSNSADDPSWYYYLDLTAEIVAVLVTTVPQYVRFI